MPNISVFLFDALGKVMDQATTDQDGSYQIVYKHKGKPADYVVALVGNLAPPQGVTLKGNTFLELNFEVFGD